MAVPPRGGPKAPLLSLRATVTKTVVGGASPSPMTNWLLIIVRPSISPSGPELRSSTPTPPRKNEWLTSTATIGSTRTTRLKSK